MPQVSFKTIESVDVSGKRVLVRVDLNVPMKNGQVTDATRIERAVPTLAELAAKGAKVIVLSHFGRPDGKRVPEMSLKPLVEPLSKALGKPVAFAEDCIGPLAEDAVRALKPGEVLLLENLRFHKEEEKNDAGLHRQAVGAGRRLCERRLLGRPSRARFDRRPRQPPAGRRRPADAGRTRGARQGAGQSQAAGLRRGRRRQGLQQARPAGQPGGHASTS